MREKLIRCEPAITMK